MRNCKLGKLPDLTDEWSQLLCNPKVCSTAAINYCNIKLDYYYKDRACLETLIVAADFVSLSLSPTEASQAMGATVRIFSDMSVIEPPTPLN